MEIFAIINNETIEQQKLKEVAHQQQVERERQQIQLQLEIENQLKEYRQAAAENLSKQTELEATWSKGIEMAKTKFDSDSEQKAQNEEEFNKSL